ncbi:MAG: flagellar export chaperone FliS [Candidatus Obscuribacterales bacterium]|nr:flagellar export chaperone FliS [Candidatus Obscuribacterales bacterium]
MSFDRNLRQFQKAYQDDALSTRVLGANPVEIIVLLYEGAIEALERASIAIEQSDFQQKSLMINKTLDIIEGLRQSLNFDKGGEISVNLDSLYDFMKRHLVSSSDAEEQVKAISDVSALLKDLLEAWKIVARDIQAKAKMSTSNFSA